MTEAASLRALLEPRSRFLSEAVGRDPGLLAAVLPALDRSTPLEALREEVLALGPDPIDASLRRWRLRHTLRVCLRHLCGADLMDVMAELSDLADAAIAAAVAAAARETAVGHGPQPGGLVVMGMGKLGARELNLSSDVDLIYLYEEDRDEKTHAWFRRCFQRATQLLGQLGPDGFVYRVDLGLRPEGSTGPICNSIAATERYYEAWGHSWERIAWLRARPVAGDLALGQAFLESLQPFVYRRHLDVAALGEVRTMKAEIDRKAAQRGGWDVKLGAGGIREIEFFSQALQLVHGGRMPALRERRTLVTLDRLALAGLIPATVRDALGAAYVFLREVEHAIQLVDYRQTHAIPSEAGAIGRVVRTLGLRDEAALESELASHRSAVARIWAGLLGDAEAPEDREDPAAGAWAANPEVAPHLEALRRSPRSPLNPGFPEGARLTRALLREVAEAAAPVQALVLLRDLVRSTAVPAAVWGFLGAHPSRLRALVQLFGSSRFLGEHLAAAPMLLEQVLYGALRSAGLGPLPDDTEEALLALRTVQRAKLVSIGYFDLGGALDADEVARRLTVLAEEVLREVVTRVRRDVVGDGMLQVAAYGRLGAGEMTYASDLDLLFLYGGDRVAWTRACQRIISGLSLQMATGRLYEVDMRLRPSGSQGPLMVTREAFFDYYTRKAAVWERLALLRARPVAGDPDDTLARTVAEVLRSPPEDTVVRDEVRRIRERQRREVSHEGPAVIDVKYGTGGLMELDLVVQVLRLRHGGAEGVAVARGTRQAIDVLAAHGILEPAMAESLRLAYHDLRRFESRLRIAHGRPIHSVRVDGPDARRLAGRLGFHDLPGRSGVQAMVERYRGRAAAVGSIFERVIG